MNPNIKFDKDGLPNEEALDNYLMKRNQMKMPIIKINSASPQLPLNNSNDNIKITVNASPVK